MKIQSLPILMAFLFVFSSHAQNASLNYSINLNNRADDQFKVKLMVDQLTKKNKVYQFAATAPGTYQTMDLGRFVSDFKAFDKNGKELGTSKVGTNGYSIKKVKKVRKITYKVADTWDTKVDENNIYRMCGTSIEEDHVLINPHCVIGYPTGMQGEPLTIKLKYPKTWRVGTALTANEDGSFYSKSYDHAVDSPILLGRLSRATTYLGNIVVDIYTYSKTDMIESEQLLASMKGMLKAAGEFVVEFPVDRYTFLYHFDDRVVGAWEHSYSSEYILTEREYTEQYAQYIKDMAAHEFFHIITPLNIHSEVIHQFNFVKPTPSQHLWLYEGTTEWAAHMMQLRYGLTTIDDYFTEWSKKIKTDSYFDADHSLLELSMNCFEEGGQDQYVNIYMRGAIVAGLLDIRLLELSNGKRGLREVINELSKKYGPDKAFSEQGFFDEFVEFTHPEIKDFFNNYIKDSKKLPIAEYYDKLGIQYNEEMRTGELVASLGGQIAVPDGKIRFVNVSDRLGEFGIKENDEIIGLNGVPVSLQNAQEHLRTLKSLNIGDSFTLKVRRGDEVLEIACVMGSKEEKKEHIFNLIETASDNQLALRKAWLNNNN